MSLLSLFKTADPIDEICDESVVRTKYRYWRLRIFLGMYFGYAFYYFTRKSLNFVLPSLMLDLSLTKVDIGIFGTIIYLSYGFSKFLSGIISDRSNPRYFMSIGLIITGIINILFGFSSSMLIFSILWFFNGMFQGWGWPPCARLLTHWYSQNERGSWWSLWSTSHNSGAALITLLCPFLAQYFGWRMGMFVPGILSIIVGMWMILTLRDTPQSLGLPPIEKFKNEDNTSQGPERELTLKERLVEHVLSNKFIWLLSFSYFFVYIIRTVINDWGMFFLIEHKGFSNIAAGTALFWFEAGGFLGILIAGVASDKIFSGRRIPISVLFSLLVLLGIAALWLSPYQTGYMVASIGMFLVGFFIFGPQMLLGIAAAEMSHKKAAGTATGFAGWFGYAGAACGSAPFGVLSHHYGWSGVFIALLVCSIFAALLLLPMWNVKKAAATVKPQLESAKENEPVTTA